MESTDARALSSDCTNATVGLHKRYSRTVQALQSDINH